MKFVSKLFLRILFSPLISTEVVIEEQLINLYNEDDIESVEASLHEVERGERLARNEAVNKVTQLTQQQTNNTSSNL